MSWVDGYAIDSPSTPSASEQNLQNFWPDTLNKIWKLTDTDLRIPEFPLRRIKRIMMLHEDVKTISTEVLFLFSKAVEFFIDELMLSALVQTERDKRRILQKSDIAKAITEYDQFDFLIDNVPREELILGTDETIIGTEQIQSYFELAHKFNAAMRRLPVDQQNQMRTIKIGNVARTSQLVPPSQIAEVIQKPQLLDQSVAGGKTERGYQTVGCNQTEGLGQDVGGGQTDRWGLSKGAGRTVGSGRTDGGGQIAGGCQTIGGGQTIGDGQNVGRGQTIGGFQTVGCGQSEGGCQTLWSGNTEGSGQTGGGCLTLI